MTDLCPLTDDPLAQVAPEFCIRASKGVPSSRQFCLVTKLQDECSHLPRFHKPDMTTRMPTRLLQLDQDNPRYVRVHLTEGQHVEYACLSYCWGEGAQFKAQTRNIRDLTTRRISLSDLPATVSDAVKLCRFFGITFLWVNALCIIQDDQEDWEREAAIMLGIFGGSATIIPQWYR